MNTFLLRAVVCLLTLAGITNVPAAELTGSTTLHSRPLVESLGLMVIFALAGILAAIVGYRLFDKFTPGDIHHEIIGNKNVAAAIVAGAVIVGVCIIVAASIAG